MSFEYINEIKNAYNRNFLVYDKKDGVQWIGKISKSLQEKGVYFDDLNSRAILAQRLSILLDLQFPEYKLVLSRKIGGLVLDASTKVVSDNVWLSKYAGITLPEFLVNNSIGEIKNIDKFFENIVFNLWIGNYDRKDYDCLVNENGYLSFIDYHLWGPGFYQDNSLALGAYAESYSIDDPYDTGWCIGSPYLIQFIREKKVKIESFSHMINKIEIINKKQIESCIVGLSFTDEGGKKLQTELIIGYLIKRKTIIHHALDLWINSGYPKGKRPKNPEHGDDIYKDI